MSIIEKLGITPGPWEFDEYGICISIEDPEQGYAKVADVRGWGRLNKKHGQEKAQEIQEANGRLIAAAPEMLDALLEATIELINDEASLVGLENAIQQNQEYVNVIEKATGKSWAEIKELI